MGMALAIDGLVHSLPYWYIDANTKNPLPSVPLLAMIPIAVEVRSSKSAIQLFQKKEN